MRVIYTLLFFVLVGLTTATAQSDKQHTLMTKKTADWCTKCGTWGWSFIKDGLVELEDENVLFWAMHYSGGISNPVAKEVSENFPGPGQPIFRLNQDDLNVSSSNYVAKIAEAKSTISALSGFPALIQVGVTPLIDSDNNITATANVKFVEGTETDYNVSLFLIRDNLVANQASIGGSAVHPNILSSSFFDETFGPLINDGNTINSNDEFSFTETLETITPHSMNIEDLKVAAVVWFKVGDQYTFINGDIQSVQMTSSADDVAQLDFDYTVIGNTIRIEFEEAVSNDMIFNLYSVDGKSIATQSIETNGNTMQVTTNGLNAGAYVMSVNNGAQIGSRQIYIVE